MDLKADVNKPSLLCCEMCRDDLDPFVAMLPYQRNLDIDLPVHNPRPMLSAITDTLGGDLLTEQGFLLVTENGEGLLT